MEDENMARDEAWLAERLRLLMENHFADVPQGHPIVTRYGYRARYRFGSIVARRGTTHILVNQLYADPFVPTYVVDATLAHELAHYAHGYGSGLPKLHAHPHRGGVVDEELEQRGLGELTRKADAWRKAHWAAFYASRCEDIEARKAFRTDYTKDLWETFLQQANRRTEAELQAHLRRLAQTLFGSEDKTPFGVVWLRATLRQKGLSYFFPKENQVQLHGLCADKRIPMAVVEFELAYWLAQHAVGNNGARIESALRKAKLNTIAEEALRWRKSAWTSFRKRNHPLA
jgi:putative component of toxin-antitoxin plasmid stabilization module